MNLEVDRSDLAQVREWSGPRAELAEGEARLRIDHFAFSANNVTYAVFGDSMRYWDFFPAGPSEPHDNTAWGRIPVWGFADVVDTRSSDLTVGEHLYGYFPMSTELIITPGRADDRGVTDLAAHRAPMAGAYNRYVRCSADPLYRVEHEDHQMLLYPLFYTSFLIDDFLTDNHQLGAGQIVISSASSKTAIGVAFLAHSRGLPTVGITSSANADFVKGLGVYDRTVDYDTIDQLDGKASVYVDVAGNRDVLQAVHRRLEGMLTHSMIVGSTHWDHQTDTSEELPAPEQVFFFAPAQIAKRTKEWGRDELAARVATAWEGYVAWADAWIRFRHVRGPAEITDVYRELLAGRADPRAGFICTLAEQDRGGAPG
jgi:hypothetical protein